MAAVYGENPKGRTVEFYEETHCSARGVRTHRHRNKDITMNRYLRVAALTGAAWAASSPAGAQSRVYTTPRAFSYEMDDPNAPRIGIFLGENTLRDTLGVLVNSVVEDGPAAKAGIKEGDRIQAI